MEPAKIRVARDQRGERTRFEDIEIGTDLGSMEWVVSEEMIDRKCEIGEEYHEWYSVDSPFDGRIAPPLINYEPPRILFSQKYNIRGLLATYECENINPIKANKKMTVSAKIVDKYIKRDREYVVYEATCVDEDGLEIFRTRRTHVLDYLPRTTPREGIGIDYIPEHGPAGTLSASRPDEANGTKE
jgi:hypothetical protein